MPRTTRSPRSTLTRKTGHDRRKETLHSGQEAVVGAPHAKEARRARTTMDSAANAVLVIENFGQKIFGAQDLGDLQQALRDNLEKASRGSHLSEEMLLSQAHALQSMFVNLACRAARQEQIGYVEAYTRLALKAQSQCRATLETIALIRNPPNISIVRQANIGGALQVNNGTAPPDSTSTHKRPLGELGQEEGHAERMDCGAPRAAGSPDSALASVGALHRPKD